MPLGTGRVAGDTITAADINGIATEVNLKIATTDANAAYAVTRRSLSAAQMVIGGGAPSLTLVGTTSIWRMDAASEESLLVMFDVPEQWVTYHVDLLWANSGAGAGNVVWRLDEWSIQAGQTIAGGFLNATVTAAAGLQDIVVSTRLLASQATPTGGRDALRVVRAATDGADTLANDAAVVALLMTRAS